jgi:hypothetical protein
MNNSSQEAAEMKELKYDKSLESVDGGETNEQPNMSLKDPDTTLSMIILLLACLAHAALAHVIV